MVVLKRKTKKVVSEAVSDVYFVALLLIEYM